MVQARKKGKARKEVQKPQSGMAMPKERPIRMAPMKFESGKVYYNFETEKSGALKYDYSAEDCMHEHVEVGCPTFPQFWPAKKNIETGGEQPKWVPKEKAKAKPKGCATAGGGGDYGASTGVWVPTNVSAKEVLDEE